MRRCLFAISLLLFSLTTSAQNTIMSKLAGQEQAQGHFTQKVYSEEGSLLHLTSGRFAVSPPDLFRWQTLAPRSELLLIDGEFLWQYDEDLLTVIRRPAPAVESTPLQLLFRDITHLTADYEISESHDRLDIIPLGQHASFQSLTVAHIADEIHIAFIDPLAQRAEIVLRLDQPGPVDITQFQMMIPSDVDVILEDGAIAP